MHQISVAPKDGTILLSKAGAGDILKFEGGYYIVTTRGTKRIAVNLAHGTFRDEDATDRYTPVASGSQITITVE